MRKQKRNDRKSETNTQIEPLVWNLLESDVVGIPRICQFSSDIQLVNIFFILSFCVFHCCYTMRCKAKRYTTICMKLRSVSLRWMEAPTTTKKWKEKKTLKIKFIKMRSIFFFSFAYISLSSSFFSFFILNN